MTAHVQKQQKQGWTTRQGINGLTVFSRIVFASLKAAQSSDWIDTTGFDRIYAYITGISGDTVKVQSTQYPTTSIIPSPATDYIEEQALTADGTVLLVGPIHWLKIECSTYSAGVIFAALEAF